MIEKVLIHAAGRSCLFIGDDAVTAYGARIQSALGVRAILKPGNSHPSTAAAIARLGADKIAASGPDPIECLAPLYLRPCEAELQQR